MLSAKLHEELRREVADTSAELDRLWKCHRCGAGGDAFAFVMQVERCDFPRALKFLGDNAGIALPSNSHSADYQREMEQKRLRKD